MNASDESPNPELESLKVAWSAAPPEPDLRSWLGFDVRAEPTRMLELVRQDVLERRQRRLPWKLDHYRVTLAEHAGPGSALAQLLIRLELGFEHSPEASIAHHGAAYAADVWYVAEEQIPTQADTEVSESASSPLQQGHRKGDKIGNSKYELVDLLGRGKFGEVWRAKELRPYREVAIKFMLPDHTRPDLLKRFTDVEPAALAQLQHPYIVAFHEIKNHNRKPYLVMEFVRGRTIDKYCDEERLPIERRLELFVKVCQAVDHVNRKNIIHRDLKPANILVAVPEPSGEPVPKLIDFGLAKSDKPASPVSPTVVSGLEAFAGTVPYSSPEQINPRPDEILTERADVYSLGALLFELIAGVRPMQHVEEDASLGDLDLKTRLAKDIRPSLSEAYRGQAHDKQKEIAAKRGLTVGKMDALLRSRIAALTDTALRIEPDDRFETAQQMGDDIANYLQDLTYKKAAKESSARKYWLAAKRNPVLSAFAALVLLAFIFTTWQWRQTVEAREAEAEQRRIALDNMKQAVESRERSDRLVHTFEHSYGQMPALHLAVAEGRIDDVRDLLNRGGPVDAKGPSQRTPLHVAADFQQLEIAKLLIDYKADVNAPDKEGHTPLTFSARRGDVALAELLLDSGATWKTDAILQPIHEAAASNASSAREIVRLLLESGESVDRDTGELALTPLMGAVSRGNLATVRLLIERGADVRRVTYNGSSALHHASGAGNVEMAKALLSAGVDIEVADNSGRRALHWAAHLGRVELMKVLLERGANIEAVNNDGHRALHFAAREGHTEAIRVLLEKGASIEATDNEGFRPLHFTAFSGDVEAVKALLDKGAQIEAAVKGGGRALHLAAGKGHADAIKVLLERGATIEAVNEGGHRALHAAADRGHTEAIKVLLDNGAQIEATNNTGWCALHLAAVDGHTEAIKVLLTMGANIEATNMNGWCALHLAAGEGHTEAINVLLEKGANIEAANEGGGGWRALHLAAGEGHTEAINVLLEKGANIEAANEGGGRALHFAAQLGRVEAIRVLLEKGANIEAADEEDWRALHYAASDGHGEAVKFLLAAGADISARTTTGETAYNLAKDAAVKALLPNPKR